ncbi:MAG: HAMP domain-containing sensor histidine kinase, partial [Ruthenibacterium sp.]
IRNPEDAAYRRGLQVIAGETDRLYDMVEELLDFSRMQNGIKLDAHVLDLVAEVSDSVLTVMQRVQLEGTRLCYEEPPLPVPVLADTARLRQVFLNILDNAAKYSPKNGTITVSVQSDGKEARVQITDEGRGISPEDLENVKIKFFKGKGAVRGSGIGLAVVDEIARAHGGRAEIESELGKGTTVTLCLPVYQNGS